MTRPAILDVADPYYTSLPPFRTAFEYGSIALMYHKMGPRPRKVRLKGLYVSKSLFERQLRELQAGGLESAGMDEIKNGAPRRFAITFDDGFVNVLRHAVPLLERYKFKAIQFLVPGLIGKTNEWEQREGEAGERLMDAGEIREWLAAGHEIGAHTLTHPFLTRLPPDRAREEIFASKKMLEDDFGVPIRHFCYPYGDQNETVRHLVREAGYETACTTFAGIITSETNPWELKRYMARHRSRQLKQFISWLRG